MDVVGKDIDLNVALTSYHWSILYNLTDHSNGRFSSLLGRSGSRTRKKIND